MRKGAESAYRLGSDRPKLFGGDGKAIAETLQEIRRRDAERLALQQAGEMYSGREPLVKNANGSARRADARQIRTPFLPARSVTYCQATRPDRAPRVVYHSTASARSSSSPIPMPKASQ